MEKKGVKQVPMDQQRLLIESTHAQGHFGKQHIYNTLVNDGKWWPSLHKDIQDVIAECQPCLQHTVKKAGFHPA